MQLLAEHCPALHGDADQGKGADGGGSGGGGFDPLSRAAGNAPRFEPHATLLAGLNDAPTEENASRIWAKVQSAVQAWRNGAVSCEGSEAKLDCGVASITTRGMFFQCVLLALQPVEPLLRLNAAMRDAFALQGQPTYFPHVSLLYGQIDEATTQELIKRAEESNKLESITFDRLSLWDTNGKVEQWRKLQEMRI